ncbi:MAG: hydrogenase maturation protease [Nitrospirae bacterium]|nr:hydrogenase maturation protease [Nitrospirota bacterium]
MLPVRVIGLGNWLRGDDAVGLHVARSLRGRVGRQVEVIEGGAGSLDLLEWIEGARQVVLIDAARSGRPAGTIHRFDASTASIGAWLFPSSTHALNVVDILELGRALGRLPPQVIVYGIEAVDLREGEALSPAVAGAVDPVAAQVLRDLEATTHA